jgi:hypothetical protein
MRVIERELNLALYRHENWRKSNTEVRVNGAQAEVYLHGNHIATLNRAKRSVEFVSGASTKWFSRTTFSRQNAIARQWLGRTVFYTHKFVPMLSRSVGDREWDCNDFYSFNCPQL